MVVPIPIAIRVEPLRLIPALLPLRVPPAFVKSTELCANAAIGSARASKNSNTILFMTDFLPQSIALLFVFLVLAAHHRKLKCCRSKNMLPAYKHLNGQ